MQGRGPRAQRLNIGFALGADGLERGPGRIGSAAGRSGGFGLPPKAFDLPQSRRYVRMAIGQSSGPEIAEISLGLRQSGTRAARARPGHETRGGGYLPLNRRKRALRRSEVGLDTAQFRTRAGCDLGPPGC